MKLKMRKAAPLVLAALAALPASAQAQRFEADQQSEVCLLNADGSRQFKISMDSLFVQVLTSALPDRFAIIQDQEDCEDPRDNNCNGEVNEECSMGNNWGSGTDCEECMATKCANHSEACNEDQECQDLAGCVVENRCFNQYGPLGCLCGAETSLTDCQKINAFRNGDQFKGECAAEFLPSLLRPARQGGHLPNWHYDDVDSDRIPTGTLSCLYHECKSECSELAGE